MGDAGQLTSNAAEVYDEFFVPALFGAWPPRLVAAAELVPGQQVLDVGCGTGVLTIAAADAVAPGGSAAGLDVNPGMLDVARRKAPQIDWLAAPAEALPFEAARFDAVVSQFALMFFRDRAKAIREMWRVLRPQGRLVLAVWDSLDNALGYHAVTTLLSRLFGDDVADLLRSPYCLGDMAMLEALFRDSGIDGAQVSRFQGEAVFPSIRSWMHTDVRGWTLSDKLDDAQLEVLVCEAERELSRFRLPDGSVHFGHPALVVTAHKP